MDVLVCLGSSVAFAYSVAVLLLPSVGEHVYFETAAMIITLITIGKLLEARAKGRASAAVSKLVELSPQRATVVDRRGQERQLSADRLLPGDMLLVRPGERFAVDGTVLEGSSAADESMLTGEPIPVDKAAGDEIYGGTINVGGQLKLTGVHPASSSCHGCWSHGPAERVGCAQQPPDRPALAL